MSDEIKFFKENGLLASKRLIETGYAFIRLEGDLFVHTDQLKQLVESHELVESYGGLNGAKVKLNSLHDESTFKPKLKQAIEDVESCVEVSSESN